MSTLMYGLRRGAGFYKPTSAPILFRSLTKPAVAAAKPSASAASLVPRRGARKIGSLLILSTMGLAYFQLEGRRASCAAGGKSSSPDFPDPRDLLAKILEKYQGEINEMGMSGLAGFCSGYCCKRISQEVAMGIGAVFMLLQTLQHMGYININYKKVNADVTKRLDLDGDGKLTQGDIHALFDSFTGYLAQGLPSASGFAGGFGLGFYYA